MKNGEDQAQGQAHTQTQEEVALVFGDQKAARAEDSHSSRRICRTKKELGRDEGFQSPALSPCIAAIASLKGSRLTLLVPVKGWSST